MLILSRRPGEVITIGHEIRVKVLEIKGRQVKLGIEAPAHIPVHRREIYEKIQEENVKAALGGDVRSLDFYLDKTDQTDPANSS